MTNNPSEQFPMNTYPPYFSYVLEPREHPHPMDGGTPLVCYYHPYWYGLPISSYGDYPVQDNARKRQRRQTAGSFMQGLFSANDKKKNSTAQPRPSIQIPPRGIGPVYDVNENDVLSGRGGRINAHKGNVQFRDLVISRKADYLSKATKKLEKAHIAANLVHYIRGLNPSGRFLKEDADGSWYDIGDAKAIKKVGQALREDAQDIRENIDSKSSEDDDIKSDEKKGTSAVNSTVAKSPTACASGGATVTTHGTKNGNSSKEHAKQTYQPIAYQTLATQPLYQAIVPSAPSTQSQLQFFPSGLGMRGAGVSGAAAAAMTQAEDAAPLRGDVAFGLPFHPPPARVDAQQETSLISGLSGPSVMSGISGLSDPISSLSMNRSMLQLQGLREQWAAHQQQTRGDASISSSAITGTRHLLGSVNLGSSLNRSASHTETNPSVDNGSMVGSMADHSLVGGGIGSGSILSGFSYGSVAHATTSYTTDHIDGVIMQSLARTSSGGRSHASRWPYPPPTGFTQQQQLHALQAQHYYQGGETGSVATMSINSTGDSLPSIPGSIMSDLSENLNALDLAHLKHMDYS
jgi:hypothetical protein